MKSAVQAAGGGPQVAGGPDLAGGTAAVEVEAENLTVSAGAQAVCKDVAARLAEAGLRCVAMEADGTVGEMVARRGNQPPARGSLLEVDATLVDGPQVRFGSAAIKDVAGLDAKRLLAGGRGRFGRVERAVFRAFPAGA
jgi:FAD/FMN-containing dehydrogenase